METAKERLARILAERKKGTAVHAVPLSPSIFSPEIKKEQETDKTFIPPGLLKAAENLPEIPSVPVEKKEIQYNLKQTELIQWMANWKVPAGILWRKMEQKELVFIGAAGTGKTTAIRGGIQRLLDDPEYPELHEGTKRLSAGMKGVVCVAYTNKAVAQIRRNVPESFKSQCLTIHKLIEFEPVYYEVYDEASGEYKVKMKFEPKRNGDNPLPSTLQTVIIDESSMVGEDLFKQLLDALPSTCRIIFIGDLNQLPPVFGDSILGRKMISLPVIELTEVYRQALDSPIINLAWKILKGEYNHFSPRTEVSSEGKMIVPSFQRWNSQFSANVRIIPWAKKIHWNLALNTAIKRFNVLSDTGGYMPMEDMILIPYNVQFGSLELNKGIAQHLGVKREAVVHEVISGINKHYYAIGDKVLYQKEEYLITDIKRNAGYVGPDPKMASKHLSRWGIMLDKAEKEEEESFLPDSLANIDSMLEALADADMEKEDRFNQASHILDLQNLFDPEIKAVVSTAGEVNGLLFSYAITVHKSQGSEWRKVFLILHNSHKTMHYRELLYTAVTRAREELEIICEPNSIERCIRNPRIKGNKLEEKLEFLRKRFLEKDASKRAAEAGLEAAEAGELETEFEFDD